MRSQLVAFILLAVLGLFLFGYSFVADSRFWKRYSQVGEAYTEAQNRNETLSRETMDRIYRIFLAGRNDRRVSRDSGVAITFVAIYGIVLSWRSRSRPVTAHPEGESK